MIQINNKAASWISSVIILLSLVQYAYCDSDDLKPLRCYRCISHDCTTSPEICALAKAYMQQEIQNYYYADGYPLPDCPAPNDEVGWTEMESRVPSSLPCGEFATGQATCVLGRFQIDSLVVETNSNITTYGTVLGCAKKRLLDGIKASTLGKDRKVMTTLSTVPGCHSDYSQSHIQDSLKHYARLEHCAQLSGWCYTSSFCIHPIFSQVRSFQTRSHNQLETPGGLGLFTIFFVAAGVVGVIVAIMTFVGIKYA